MRTAAVYGKEPQSSLLVIPFGVGHHWLMARGGEARHCLADRIARKVKQKGCTAFLS
jgi:hypothetical protein